jgi:NAD+ kinase
MVKKIGIIAKSNRQKALDHVKLIIPYLEERDCEVFVDSKTGELLNMEGLLPTEIVSLVDLMIVLGGDGTLLSVARTVGEKKIPILGINLGSLGFLTEIPCCDIFSSVDKALNNELYVEERMMLNATVIRENNRVGSFHVLNEVVVHKGSIARIIDVETYINTVYVTTFRADGLIISSPTGSTGYSLSAGGPILYPTLHCINVTPVSPHTLTNRPLVVPDNSIFQVVIKTPDEEILLSLDGQYGFHLKYNDVVEIKKSDFTTRLLIPHERDYFYMLREKLKWGGRVDTYKREKHR